MSHTAAPWLKREMYAGTRRYRIEIYARFDAGRGEHPICQIPGGFTNQDEDAALILAAPDLLGACRMAVSRCVHCKGAGFIDVKEFDGASGRMEETGRTERCPACGPIVAAIAKAEGSQS